jgi:predicted O-methyltransferase YrrM
MSSPLNDQNLEQLLDRLHTASDQEISVTDAYFEKREREGSLNYDDFCDQDMHRFYADKMVALDRDKSMFCYQLCRAMGASRIVEAGTSFGISTLYLAAAVRDNDVEDGIVIGTEHEPHKAKIALETFKQAGLQEYIDLREGDLRETLKDVGGMVDFMLVDIWDVAKPALELVSPYLRPGAIVVCDNTTVDAAEYRDYFEFLNDPKNRLSTMTLPFQGGFELSVRI